MANKLLIALNLDNSRKDSGIFHCKNFEIVYKNIIEKSKDYTHCLIINDKHKSSDKEFKYLPPHSTQLSEQARPLYLEKQIKCPVQFLTKSTMNCFHSNHIKEIVNRLNAQEILLTGFNTSVDILASIIGGIDLGFNIFSCGDCIGDISDDINNKSINQIKWLGVEI